MTYDQARHTCPIQRQAEQVVVYGHPEMAEGVSHPKLFSNAVSRFLQLPNGLDGAEHQRWRAMTDPYLMDPGNLRKV